MKKKPEDDKPQISRRAFLGTGAAAGAATIIPAGGGGEAAAAGAASQQESRVTAPSAEYMAREVGAGQPQAYTGPAVKRPGST